LGVELSRS